MKVEIFNNVSNEINMDNNNCMLLETIKIDGHNDSLEINCDNTSSSCNDSMIHKHGQSSSQNECQSNFESKLNDNSEKHNAIWTTNSIETLLKLYDTKLEMLETPKKKTRIWIAISDSLRDYGIEVSPDQVRWKINALAKKYKQCIDSGHHRRFKYFNEMDNIYSRYNVDCDSYTIGEVFLRRKNTTKQPMNGWSVHRKTGNESKAMIQLRKMRLASRMESDRRQTKLHVEKQWLEYLKRQEQHERVKEDIFDRSLKIREEELEIKKRKLKLKESLEYKKIELAERDLNEIINIGREKCELLKQMFNP